MMRSPQRDLFAGEPLRMALAVVALGAGCDEASDDRELAIEVRKRAPIVGWRRVNAHLSSSSGDAPLSGT